MRLVIVFVLVACFIPIFESKATEQLNGIKKLEVDVKDLENEVEELIDNFDSKKTNGNGIGETTIDSETGSQKIDVKDPPLPGIDETTIDAKTGSLEEIDKDESSKSDMTEVEINQELGFMEDEEKFDENDKRSAGGVGIDLWPKVNGQLHIPYEIDAALPTASRQKIVGFINKMNSLIKCNPNVWKPRTGSEPDYVRFVNGKGCSSFVGKIDEAQNITLAYGCIHYNQGTVLHEMLHTMGLSHEHSRPDRDDFVTIKFENIKTASLHNFRKKTKAFPATLNSPYDYGSVMHYRKNAFSSNGKDTIITKNGEAIGQRNGLSAIDVAELNALYECNSIATTTTTTTTAKPPIVPNGIEILNCGFGSEKCGGKPKDVRLTYKEMVKVECENEFQICDEVTERLCDHIAFRQTMRNRCGISCGTCSDYYKSGTKQGFLLLYIYQSYLQRLNICTVPGTKQKACLRIKYIRTDLQKAPKFYASFTSWSLVNKYRRIINMSVLPTEPRRKEFIKKTFDFVCTERYYFVSVFVLFVFD